MKPTSLKPRTQHWAKLLLLSLLLMLLGLTQRAQAADNPDTLTRYVASTDEWNTLAKKYGSTQDDAEAVYLKIKLCNSLYLTNKSTTWTWFQGEIDGQGYTINVDFPDTDTDDKFVFKNLLNASFANFFIRGTVEFRFGYYSYTYHLPFALKVYDNCTATFNNCHSYIGFIEASDGNVYKYSYQPTGGFIGHMKQGSTASFTDCSFVGSFRKLKDHDDPWFDTAGFVGGAYFANIEFRNCLSYITFMEGSRVEDNRTGFFVGHKENAAVSVSNCYCYSPSSIASLITDVYVDNPVSIDQILSGEITYKLNANRTGDKALWFQTIGTDTVPGIYKWSNEVFYQKKVTRPATTDQWTTLFYPQNVTLPDGTTKYVVTGLKDGKASLSELTISNTADVPMVLHNDNGFSQIELPALYFNKSEQSNLLRGVYESSAATATDYLLSGSKFVSGKDQTMSPWTCYIANGTGDGYEIETNAKGIYVISSKEAWNTFKTLYGSGEGTEVTAYLDCDLTLTADDVAMERFKGTLDGQGHSIIYDYDDLNTSHDDNTLYGFIKYAEGTIKNLNITGSIKTKCRFIGGPLAWTNFYGALNVENCHSDVNFCTTYSELTYTFGSGFMTSTGNAANFTDCSFTGSFTSDKIPYTGGFVGEIWYDSKVTFTNCYSNIHTGASSAICSEASAGYFVGTMQARGSYSFTNCYAHNSGELDFSANSTGTGIIIPTDEQIKSGEVTFALNNWRDDMAWAQTIGTDSDPQVKATSPESYDVKKATGTISKNADAHWATLYYPTEVTFAKSQGIDIYDSFALENGSLYIYENLSGSLKACTPALLYAENGFTEDIKLPMHFYNEEALTNGSNYIFGTKTDTDASSLYLLGNASADTPTFDAPTGSATLPAWQCYTTQPFSTVALDGSIIYSKDDWNRFKTKYNNKKQGFARLACDLTLTDDDAPMEKFVGTFDGQGHTITVNYSNTDTQNPRAPFFRASGTIRNLHITGTISYPRYNAALAYCILEGETLNVENSHSSVTFTHVPSTSDEKVSFYGAGFIKSVGVNPMNASSYEGCHVNFKDCSFTGGFVAKDLENDKMNSHAGFVTNLRSNNSVNFENCLSTISSTAAIDVTNRSDYFVPVSSGTITTTNCYAQKSLSGNGDNPTEYTNTANVTVLSPEEMKSGKVTYLLNAGRTGDDAAWTQTIDTDTMPQLKIFSKDSKEVYEANGGDYKLGTTGWGTLYYPTDVTLADGVKAYTVSNVEEKKTDRETENYVVLTEVPGNTLPAYTAAILCSLAEGSSSAKEITIPLKPTYYNDAKSHDIEEGMTAMLYGMLERTVARDGWFIMQNHNGVVAFYQVDTDVAQPSIPAFRCALLWVPKEDQQSSAKVNLRFESETLGISSVLEPLLRDGAVYDLQGRKVQSLQKNQIYIKNGRKFIVR